MPRYLALATVLALLLLGLAACGGDDEATPTTTAADTTTVATPPPPPPPPPPPAPTSPPAPAAERIEIVVEGGRPQGGIARPKVSQGDRVVLVVRSDVADEVHLHGYDLSADVPAGGTARISFVADVPGRFEVELEDTGVQLADLTVEP